MNLKLIFGLGITSAPLAHKSQRKRMIMNKLRQEGNGYFIDSKKSFQSGNIFKETFA